MFSTRRDGAGNGGAGSAGLGLARQGFITQWFHSSFGRGPHPPATGSEMGSRTGTGAHPPSLLLAGAKSGASTRWGCLSCHGRSPAGKRAGLLLNNPPRQSGAEFLAGGSMAGHGRQSVAGRGATGASGCNRESSQARNIAGENSRGTGAVQFDSIPSVPFLVQQSPPESHPCPCPRPCPGRDPATSAKRARRRVFGIVKYLVEQWGGVLEVWDAQGHCPLQVANSCGALLDALPSCSFPSGPRACPHVGDRA
jgi:hypothetical protein